jgi:hypothetical protein
VFTDPEFSQAFQLMMYAWLYHQEHPEEQSLAAGIISLRTPGDGPAMFKPPGADHIDTDVLESFEEELIRLIKEIFDPNTPFTQTDQEQRCKYCTFREICNRSLMNKDF